VTDLSDGDKAFQKWIVHPPGTKAYPRAFTEWARAERQRWETGSAHARAMRERQKLEGGK
jgi:hypothetical protein